MGAPLTAALPEAEESAPGRPPRELAGSQVPHCRSLCSRVRRATHLPMARYRASEQFVLATEEQLAMQWHNGASHWRRDLAMPSPS